MSNISYGQRAVAGQDMVFFHIPLVGKGEGKAWEQQGFQQSAMSLHRDSALNPCKALENLRTPLEDH